jgi:hypothetical protein|tara:strand:+ start:37418 stop:37645 length:228 start_codon:yes stop_codon:yes gene_type:complete
MASVRVICYRVGHFKPRAKFFEKREEQTSVLDRIPLHECPALALGVLITAQTVQPHLEARVLYLTVLQETLRNVI